MAKTENIPPEWQRAVAEAIKACYEKKAKTEKPIQQILNEAYEKLRVEFGLGDPGAQHMPGHLHAYMSANLIKVIRHAVQHAKQNPPTHRKGYGDSWEKTVVGPPDLIWKYDQTRTGDLPQGDGDGFPEPEDWEPDYEGGQVPNILSTVRDVRDRYGYDNWPTREQLGAMLNEMAWRHRDDGWGLSAKPGGYNVPMPNGTLIASDILHHGPTNLLVDVLQAAGEASIPQWDIVGYPQAADRVWLAPIPP